MQLRRLEVHGFKTFANSTTLEFSPGITAIVGPNGSGKSNIADCMIWALGEGNVRTLRGGKLQDVIFAGSSNRRPIGMAEVTLTFDNTSRTIPLDASEISITRRVYRSDESEYFINRTACRLKDIVELFMDTGVGKESYFALNQGQIDMILSADPQERRILFEEAAGVKKYRVRKRESLRKLETTEQNLIRIYDLLAEIESRVGPLERQAEAARRYLEIEDRMRTTELGAFAADWAELSSRMAADRDKLSAAQVGVTGADSELATLAALEETAHLDLQDANEQLESAHQNSEDLSNRQARVEGEIQLLEEQIRSGHATAEQSRLRLQEMEQRKEEAVTALTSLRKMIVDAETDRRTTEAEISGHRAKLLAAEARMRSVSAELEQARSREMARVAHSARRQADHDASHRRLDLIRERKAQLISSVEQLEERKKTIQVRRTEILSGIAENAKLRDETSAELSLLEAQITVASDRAQACGDQVRDMEGKLAGQTSRLRLLEEMQEHREGFYSGVKQVIQATESGKLPGHYRAVADLLTVKPEHETALEAALGGHVQDIVTHTDEEARTGINFLKQTGSGRATFLSIMLVERLSHGGQRPDTDAPGVIGSAVDLVTFDPVYQPVMEMLIGQVLVCDTLENANSAARSLSDWSRVVTLDGEVITSRGAMTGGSRQQGRSALIGRISQIQDLRSSIAQLTEELGQRREHQSSLSEHARQIQQQRAEVDRKRQQIITETARRSSDQEHLDHDDERIVRDIALLQADVHKAEQQEKTEVELMTRLSAQSDEQLVDGGAMVEVASVRQVLDAILEEREAIRQQIASVQSVEASLQERKRSLTGQIEESVSRLNRIETEIRTVASRLQVGADTTAMGLRKEILEKELESVRKQISDSHQGATAIRTRREACVKTLEEIATATRAANRKHQDALQVVYEAETLVRTLDANLEHIRTSLRDDYGVGKTSNSSEESGLENNSAPENVDDEGSPTNRSDDPEYSAISNEDLDLLISAFISNIIPSRQPDQDRRLATRLRRQMHALEPVNLQAIEESTTVTERLAFLKAQQSDVEAAARDLKLVIARIDEEAKERFLTTFRSIGEHFDDLFRQLFGGGQTRLSLTDPSDPTESGVEISAQPPGKRLQNLALLSGGERSLTAVALLFAMLKVHPAPFCIMDEVDSALDEANIFRLGNMLKQFAINTQFIIITHSRGTMEIADRLYGITMTEPGVSSILTVKLTDLPEDQNLTRPFAVTSQ